MLNRKSMIVLALLALASLFCSVGGFEVPEGIQETLEALTQQVPMIETQIALQLTAAAVTPQAGSGGSVSGNLSYPSEGIPPLRVVAFRTDINEHYSVDTLQNQSTFQLDNLPAGPYYVVAYTMDGSLSGGYTQAVPCGLSVDCTDHSLIVVNVTDGQISGGVNPADWYAPPGTFPPFPAP